MSRQVVRSLKKAVRNGASGGDRVLGQASALALLERSIGFGHDRLAVIRLWSAVLAGAAVPPDHWAYCARVVAASRDKKVQGLFRQAAVAGGLVEGGNHPHSSSLPPAGEGAGAAMH